MNIAPYLDFANHHPDAKAADIRTLCKSVLKYGFNAAFVNQCYVPLAKSILKGKAKVGTIVSFPLGQDLTDAKTMSAVIAAKAGADELDACMNVGWFRDGRYKEVLEEMKAVVAAAKKAKPSVIVKFIIEAGYLTKHEIAEASRLVLASGADFVKIASGMGPRGTRVEDVIEVRKAIGNKISVKAAGGIATYETAIAMINAGANRIGTSHAIEIFEAAKKKR